jgi:hypothetical protein
VSEHWIVCSSQTEEKGKHYHTEYFDVTTYIYNTIIKVYDN